MAHRGEGADMFKIIEHTKLWFTISLTVIAIGMGFVAFRGLNYGIDFVGGTVMQVDLKTTPDMDELRDIASKYTNDAVVSSVDQTGVVIRSSAIAQDKKTALKNEISKKYSIDVSTWEDETVGPSIGRELRNNAIIAVLVSMVGILIYVTVRYEIRFAVSAILALLHDVLITISVYAILQIPVNNAFIAAILTIIGYSLDDTIVIFDRIRENMKIMKNSSLEELADLSITETMSRSINTVLLTLFTIVAVYFIGVSAVKELALPLILGIISGCYSTIFIASPIWVLWKKSDNKKRSVARARA